MMVLACETCSAVRGGRGVYSPLCSRCATRARAWWTRRRIIDAIQAWTAEHDAPPRQEDWHPCLARARGHHDTADQFDSATYPWASIVRQRFGTWNAAIAAAGYTPRHPGRPRLEELVA